MPKLILLALTLALLSGCATLGAPRPTDPSDPNQIAIDSAGDVGALCVMVAVKGSPEDVRKAQLAAAAASAVLADPVPSFAVLSEALSAAMPRDYAALSAVILQRLKVRLGQADVIPHDTVAWAMAEAFTSACSQALGGLPTA